MKNRTKLTAKYGLVYELFFILICMMLVGIEFFLGSGDVKVKGILTSLMVFQIPIIVLTVRHWLRLGKDEFLN